jgi:hypothetical protein
MSVFLPIASSRSFYFAWAVCCHIAASTVSGIADLAADQILFFAIKAVGKALDSAIDERFIHLASTR